MYIEGTGLQSCYSNPESLNQIFFLSTLKIEEESTFFKQPKQKKTQVQKSTSTVRNYFQPSNTLARPAPSGQSENGAILAPSTTRTQRNIDNNSHPYNNQHSSENNDDVDVNLLPRILPNLASGSTR